VRNKRRYGHGNKRQKRCDTRIQSQENKQAAGKLRERGQPGETPPPKTFGYPCSINPAPVRTRNQSNPKSFSFAFMGPPFLSFPCQIVRFSIALFA
jgi:hypothetical protein